MDINEGGDDDEENSGEVRPLSELRAQASDLNSSVDGKIFTPKFL